VRSRHWRLAPLEPDVPNARAYFSAILAIRIVLILGLIGIFEMKTAIGSHRVTAAPIVWLVLSLLAGAGMGAVRGATVRIWRAEDGSAWRQGTVLTAALWIVSLATHLVLDAVIDHSTTVTTLGSSSLLVYLAVTLGVQREIVRWRASRLVRGLNGTWATSESSSPTITEWSLTSLKSTGMEKVDG
jgi:hypothetical protein